MATRTVALILLVLMLATLTPVSRTEATPADQFPTGCPAGEWKVLYWGNLNLAGTATDAGCMAGPLDKTYADGQQPYPGIGPYQWSARYVGNFPIAGGNQTFTATFDDSVRVAVDSSSLWTIDDWAFGAVRTKTGVKNVNPNVPDNLHTVWVEFRNNGYGSRVKVDWTGANPPTATPTATATATFTPTPTSTSTPTPVPTDTPTPTNTPVPPTNTPTPTNTPVSQAGQQCSAATHDAYHTADPEGVELPTWHPQIDPVSGCHFGHEHGNGGAIPQAFRADGSLYRPVFGYADRKNNNGAPIEAHQGFKVYVTSPAQWNGNWWVITHHFGTFGTGRFCQFNHETDITIIRDSDKKILLESYTVAPHGHAVTLENVIYQPAFCSTQHEDYLAYAAARGFASKYGTSYLGQRAINLVSGVNYEPWDAFISELITGVTPAFPNGRFDFAPNTTGVNKKCTTIQCTTVVDQQTTGADRFFDYGGYGMKRTGASTITGTYYTHPDGTSLQTVSDANSVRQFADPGPWDAPVAPHPDPASECYYRSTTNGVHGEYLPMNCATDPVSFPPDFNIGGHLQMPN